MLGRLTHKQLKTAEHEFKKLIPQGSLLTVTQWSPISVSIQKNNQCCLILSGLPEKVIIEKSILLVSQKEIFNKRLICSESRNSKLPAMQVIKFIKCKELQANSSIRAYPNESSRFSVMVDASDCYLCKNT